MKNIRLNQLVIIALTVSCLVGSFPTMSYANLAFVFAVPFLIGAYFEKSKKATILIAIASSWISWFFILFWLRHVTWVGTLVVSAYTATFTAFWLIAAGLSIKRIITLPALRRILALTGLAALWVILEWVRSFLFSGFQWLPLSASQWERPALLQLSAFTGSYGPSFIIAFFNLALASFILKLYNKHFVKINKIQNTHSRPIELYLAITLVLGSLSIYSLNLPDKQPQQFDFRVGVIQPDINPFDKWDQSKAQENFQTLWDQTIAAGKETPDLIIWPETALPSPLNQDENARNWVAHLSKEINTPILAGALGNNDSNWYNSLYKVTPQDGVDPNFYAKEHRVPFGEYVPFRNSLPFLNKYIPVSFDLTPGNETKTLQLTLNQKNCKFGGLICYEDIFPELARNRVLQGADALVVITNNAWYGREAAAYQHAANSVLRAIETRRPILRCGNNGLSGWIDEFGSLREIAQQPGKGVYFRGMKVFDFYRHNQFINKHSFYTKNGDWFIASSAILLLIGAFCTLPSRKK